MTKYYNLFDNLHDLTKCIKHQKLILIYYYLIYNNTQRHALVTI